MSSSDNDTIDLQVMNDYIAQVLPAVSSAQRAEIVDTFVNIGVEKPCDLQFIDESDLEPLMLKKVQLRKLMKGWDTGQQVPASCAGSSLSSPSSVSHDTPGCSSSLSDTSVESSPGESPSQDPVACVPWSKFPQELITEAKAGRRPSPSIRKEMVRIIVDSLFQRDRPTPRIKVLRVLAQEVVHKYPKSFADEVDGVKIGTGYDSLLSQLIYRVDNLSRQQKSTGKKRKLTSTPEAKNKKHDAYGCVNWQPLSLPDGETEESQEEIRKELQQMYGSGSQADEEEVQRKMDLTYATQRAMLNQPDMVMLDTTEQWPYLFVHKHMMSHFKKLVDLDIETALTESFERRGPKLLRFFKLHPESATDSKVLRATLSDVDEACRLLETEMPRVIGLVYLLCAVFGEDTTSHVIDAKEVGEPVDSGKLPGHPCLIAHGNPLQTSSFSLSVGQVVTTRLQNPVAALSAWFAAYYIFNLHYPTDAAGVPEFIQRFFLGINPKKGSKKKGTRKSGVNPGVLKLANQLANFENEWGI